MIWDLLPGKGVYTHIDLNEAKKFEYKFTVIEGCVWGSEEKVFDDYIKNGYKLKQKGQDEGNMALRQTGKILLNSLYGKMLQKKQGGSSQLCYNNDEVNEFTSKYQWDYSIYLNDEIILMVGDKLEESFDQKPYHLGSMVLANSRKVMNDFLKDIDPYCLPHPRCRDSVALSMENTFMYTDTDSYYVKGEQMSRIELGEELGMMKDESQKSGKIIMAYFLGKKMYAYMTIKKDNTLHVTLRCKGITNSYLSLRQFWESYHKPWFSEQIIQKNSIKSHGISSSDTFCQVKSVEIKRTFHKTPFKSRYYVNNDFEFDPFGVCSLPHGHKMDEHKMGEKQYGSMLNMLCENVDENSTDSSNTKGFRI